MKRLFFLIVIITLPIIAYFQYANWKRFHPSTDYNYQVSKSIDPNYHDQSILTKYYKNAVEIGSFARTKWRNEGIDVRFPDSNSNEELAAANYYNQLIAETKLLEAQLEKSMELKSRGLDNAMIRSIELTGLSAAKIKMENDRNFYINTAPGQSNKFVWNIQKRLIELDYDSLPLDGRFGPETYRAIQDFQTKNKLYPSGQLDDEMFELLFLGSN